MTRRYSHTELQAVYENQQLVRKRKQFELTGHASEAATTLHPRATRPPTPETGTESPTATRAVATPPSQPTRVMMRLRVRRGPDTGREFELHEGTFVIGRGPKAFFHLKDDSVSSDHALLVVTSRRVTIRDSGSLNGTSVNATKVKGPDVVIIKVGNEIILGDTHLIAEPGDPDE